MRMYKILNGKTLLEIERKKVGKEKTLQKLTEDNLELIFGLEFVSTEFAIDEYRIDTLAFDKANKSFVVIEYKRGENWSVIDQGYSYLGKMLERKADFVLHYNNLKKTNYTTKDIVWEHSRVIFVSTYFNKFQRGALNFNDLPISLWEVALYHNDHISFIEIESNGSSDSITTLGQKDSRISTVGQSVIVYKEEDHTKIANEDISDLYYTLKAQILKSWDLKVEYKKKYIAFKYRTNILDIEIQKSQLKIWLNLKMGELIDKMNITRDVSNIGHPGNGDYQINIQTDEYLPYILNLIEQVINIHKRQ